ncbi:glycosyltransferase family 4 protein [Chloroflexota bacterium]
MKILYLAHADISLPVAAAVHVGEMVNSLSQQGHQIILNAGCSSLKKPPGFLSPGITFHNVGFPSSKNFFIQFFQFLMSRLLSLYWAVGERRNYDVIYIRGALEIEALPLRFFLRKPLVAEVNGSGILEKPSLRDKLILCLLKGTSRLEAHYADRFITVTPELKTHLVRTYHVPEARITISSNGVNTKNFRPMDIAFARSKIGLNGSELLVGCVSVFDSVHDLRYLVGSAPLVLQQCPNTKFLLVGDGPLRPKVEQKVREMNLESAFLFTGMVPHSKVPLFINACDAMVAPLVGEDVKEQSTSALKIHEYMACGKPVILPDCGSFSNTIVESRAGIVANPQNPPEMAEAIVKLLKDRHLRGAMGRSGRQIAEQKYSWEKVAQRLTEVCKELLSDR